MPSRRVVAALVCGSAALLAAVGARGDAQSGTPARRVQLVTVDPAGRPYDVALLRGASSSDGHSVPCTRRAGACIFTGGENVPFSDPGGDPVLLAERQGRRYRVDAVWVRYPTGEREIVGVVLVERDGTVIRWRQLQRVAYGTDAGTGAIITPEAAHAGPSARDALQKRWDTELIEHRRQFFVVDADGTEGDDTLVFSNGFGDGGFPSIGGYDRSGRRAAIVLWSIVAPWRLAFPEGRPPSQVTARENALAACLAGKRKIDGLRCRRARPN